MRRDAALLSPLYWSGRREQTHEDDECQNDAVKKEKASLFSSPTPLRSLRSPDAPLQRHPADLTHREATYRPSQLDHLDQLDCSDTPAGVARSTCLLGLQQGTHFLLRERGQQLGEGLVQALTRFKSRQLAALLTSDPEPEAADGEQALPELEAENRDEKDQRLLKAYSKPTSTGQRLYHRPFEVSLAPEGLLRMEPSATFFRVSTLRKRVTTCSGPSPACLGLPETSLNASVTSTGRVCVRVALNERVEIALWYEECQRTKKTRRRSRGEFRRRPPGSPTVLRWVNDTVMAELPTFESVRSTMYREKKKQQPSLPRNMAEINLGRLYTETLDKRDFLLFDISISAGRILCFCTQELLFHFAEVVEVFIDGTFFSCPSLFHQLLTISAVKEGVSFNMAYFLLPGKSREVYVAAFTNFKAAFDALRAPLLLNVVRTDFELALIQAFLFVFPGIRHRGCHFHFSQAIWRKVQDLGLSKAYQEDSSVTLFVRQTISLAFVPPTFVRVAWRSLKATAPQAPGVPQLILYFEDTWLLGNYEIHQWNHHQNNGARTNNFKEAWHRKINNVIGKAHPNVYTFVEHIKQDEATSRVTLHQVSNGGQARKRQKKWEMKDEAIKKLEERLSNGELSIQEFLKLVQRYCGI
ncbi:hypothetical protein HPB47_013946 [Ixodes persulcatus]|uniref:Uncharacterized protein n=1 Tax=Ixodes persulcatus TaxID=34615 RepID=A0AC60QXJ1_IXOPE|nr:hypothetical protein HPB47_013946 [Ixodes persulcatus]